MEYITVNNLRIPKIGIGTYSIRGEALKKIINNISDRQFDNILIDTAYKYSNESELGEIILKNPNNIIVQTKVCARQLVGSLRLLRLDRKTPLRAFKESQFKIGKEYLKIYMLHSPFPGYEKYLSKFSKINEKENVIIGVCNFTKAQLEAFKREVGWYPKINQIEMHPYFSNAELAEFCRNNGIIVEARSPFAHGDAIDDWDNNITLKEIAQSHSKNIFQIILRWIIQNGHIAIFRSQNVNHINSNYNIWDFELTDKEIEAINALNRDKSYGFISNVRK